jgi:branched-chain amino acid transport system permease protein
MLRDRFTQGAKSRFVGLLALMAVLVVVPFYLGTYYINVLTLLLINVILVSSFRLITTTGGWNLAHIPLMGLGAYTSAILAKSYGLPFWLTLPLAGLGAAVAGLVFSLPLRRTKGLAFFIASFAAGEAMRESWTRLTVPFGGHRGIYAIPAPDFSPIPGLQSINFAQPLPFYFLTFVVTLVCLLVMYRIDKSRIGHTFAALYSQESLAKSVGIDIPKYKTLAFALGSLFAGIAGGLLAHYQGSIDPSSFGFIITMYLLVWVIFGGTHSFVGPLLGVTSLTILHTILENAVASEWIPLVYGVILIVTLVFLRGGIESLPEQLSHFRLRNLKKLFAR